MSSAVVAAASAVSPETAASTRGSICPRSARTSRWPSSASTARRNTAGMLCSPLDAVMRPAAPSDPVHAPRSRPSGAEVLIEPGVPVGGGDPFRLAPLEQRRDQRRAVPELFEPPRAGVRHVDPRRREERLHLGRAAQVRGRPVGRVPQHLRVARRPDGRGVGRAARPRPDDLGEQALRRGPADRQPVRGQLRAQQLSSGFRTSGADPGPAPLLLQAGKLQPGGLKRRGRPEDRRVRGVRGHAEQVGLTGEGRHLIGRLPVQASPHVPGLRPPPAEQEPVHRGDIPAGSHPNPARHQSARVVLRPDHPPRPDLLIGHPDIGDRRVRTRPRRPQR